MRILQWAFPHHVPLGGREIFTERLSKSLVGQGHEVLLMADSSSENSPIHDVETVDGELTLHRLNLNSFGKLTNQDGPNLRREIKSLIDGFSPDVIHYHNFYSKSLVFLSAYLRARPNKIPVIYTVHDIETLSKIAPALRGELIRNVTDVIVSPSEYIRKRYLAIDTTSSKKHLQIYNGVPDAGPSKINGPLQVLAAASFESHKGLVVLLTAWKSLSKKFPGVQLILAGEGRERDFLMEYARKLDLLDTVRFTGWLNAHELRREFEKDTIVVAPSLIAEAFGLIAAEAQMAALPVVASDIGGLREVVADRNSGFLVSPGSSRALEEALAELLANETLRRQMGEAGRERSLEKFDLALCTQRYADLYESVHE